jgi:hypothetical protein
VLLLQLLDLHGRDSYLLCDVTKAHDYLWTLPLTQGYSDDVIEGRRELLDNIKERALLQEGRVKQDSRGIDVPVQLLPSALALLAQVRPHVHHGQAVFRRNPLLSSWGGHMHAQLGLVHSWLVVLCKHTSL